MIHCCFFLEPWNGRSMNEKYRELEVLDGKWPWFQLLLPAEKCDRVFSLFRAIVALLLVENCWRLVVQTWTVEEAELWRVNCQSGGCMICYWTFPWPPPLPSWGQGQNQWQYSKLNVIISIISSVKNSHDKNDVNHFDINSPTEQSMGIDVK